MNKKEIKERLDSGIKKEVMPMSNELESLIKEFKPFAKSHGWQGVFAYAHTCERFFEAMCCTSYERKTTFAADFSIAEWCFVSDGISSVIDTLRNAVMSWYNDIEFMAELVLVMNIKSWEHSARGNDNWSALYAELYYLVRDLYLDIFADNQKAMDYYFANVD